MEQNNHLSPETYWSDIVRAAAKVVKNDSERVKRLKSRIQEINKALESGNSDKILCTNSVVCQEFGEIIFTHNSGISPVTRDFMETQPLQVQKEALRAIGIVLYKAILAEKVIQTVQEGGKVVINKALQNCLKEILGINKY